MNAAWLLQKGYGYYLSYGYNYASWGIGHGLAGSESTLGTSARSVCPPSLRLLSSTVTMPVSSSAVLAVVGAVIRLKLWSCDRISGKLHKLGYACGRSN